VLCELIEIFLIREIVAQNKDHQSEVVGTRKVLSSVFLRGTHTAPTYFIVTLSKQCQSLRMVKGDPEGEVDFAY